MLNQRDDRTITRLEVSRWLKRHGYPNSFETLRMFIRDRRFPQGRRVSLNRTVWNLDEIEAWQRERELRQTLKSMSSAHIIDYAQAFTPDDWRATVVKWAASAARDESQFAARFDELISVTPRDYRADIRAISNVIISTADYGIFVTRDLKPWLREQKPETGWRARWQSLVDWFAPHRIKNGGDQFGDRVDRATAIVSRWTSSTLQNQTQT